MLQLLSQLPLYVTSGMTLLVASGVCLLIAATTEGKPAACVFDTYDIITAVLWRHCYSLATLGDIAGGHENERPYA